MEKLLDHLESHAEEPVPENIDTDISDIQVSLSTFNKRSSLIVSTLSHKV